MNALPTLPATIEPIEIEAPRPLGREAFHGILGEIVKKNDPYTESAEAAVLIQFTYSRATLSEAARMFGPIAHVMEPTKMF